jgi:ATP-dependent Clp protease ATP-binding subunit ClpB
MVQQRLENAAAGTPFLVSVAESAQELLLREGTDSRYGARHLKRAIERLLVQPLSNLMASGQIRRGDSILVSHSEGSPSLMFYREAVARDGWRVAGSIAA